MLKKIFCVKYCDILRFTFVIDFMLAMFEVAMEEFYFTNDNTYIINISDKIKENIYFIIIHLFILVAKLIIRYVVLHCSIFLISILLVNFFGKCIMNIYCMCVY